jgi:hypothetical protein
MFHPHFSPALRDAFARKPYQGQAPELAKYIFIGLDANYAEDVERSPVWPDLLEYLEDGVRFWRERGVHHPFLLPSYRGDGRKYHRTFSKIGFTPEDASEVCFVELVHVPTFGRSALVVADLDRDHLRRVRAAIEAGRARHVFVPDRVGRLMRASGEFPWMPKGASEKGGPLRLWCDVGPAKVHWHYHLSVYGKFESGKAAQLVAIRRLVDAVASA